MMKKMRERSATERRGKWANIGKKTGGKPGVEGAEPKAR